MEGNSLEIKIKKQKQFIKEQIARFKRGFDSKELKSHNFTPYLQALNKAFDLNNSYGEDYYQFIEKKDLQFVLKNNRDLMKDVSLKLKGLSLYFQQNKIQTKEKLKKNDGICNICQQLIDSQNVIQAKNSVEDVGINKLKRMLKMIQQQSNMSIFSAQEDKNFFQELHRVLTKKQQILSITDNHLQKYLDDIVKNMQEIKYLQNLKDTSFPLPQSIDWETKIKNQINIVLLGSFKGKVPVWIQKMFDYFLKLQSKFMRQLKQSKQCQTQPYIQDEVQQLKNKIQEYKEKQRANKVINQDYHKLMQQKKSHIQNLQIQFKVLKENLNNQDIAIRSKKIRNQKNVNQEQKQQKSYRNSSIKNNIFEQGGNIEKSKSQNRFKKLSNMSSSLMGDSLNQSSVIKKIKKQFNESQVMDQKMSNSYEGSLRKEHLVTEHLPELPSTVFQEKVQRKKNKKLTDIQFFKRSLSKQKGEYFLPNVYKIIKDSNGEETLQQIKKTSIMSNSYQSFNKSSQKRENLQFLNLKEKINYQKYINKISQDTQQCISESEINLTENFTDSERKIRLKKYKQKVSDVQNQLENKVHKIEALKKTFDMKKLNTSASFTAKVSPLYSQLSPLNKMSLNRFTSSILPEIKTKTETKDFMTQTQTQQGQKILINHQDSQEIQKKLPLISRIKTQQQSSSFSNLQVHRLRSSVDDVNQSKQLTRQRIFKKLSNNKSLQKISEDHLEKILSKLLLVSEKNTDIKRSPKKSTQRYKNEKSKKNLQADRSLGKSKILQSKREEQKQNDNEKKLQKEISLPKIVDLKQVSLKEKLIENAVFGDKSPTSKSKNTSSTVQGLQIPNISGVHTVNKKNQPSCSFTKKDFSLFINEQNSYKYQLSIGKKYHKTPSVELTKEQIQNFTSVYGITQMIKSHSQQNYDKIISFLKYPYHSVVNNFSILNIVKDMSLETWLWHFSLIQYYHQKCVNDNDENKFICGHVEKFVSKIQDTLVDLVSPYVKELISDHSKQQISKRK